jgi:hypothetical protein
MKITTIAGIVGTVSAIGCIVRAIERATEGEWALAAGNVGAAVALVGAATIITAPSADGNSNDNDAAEA